MHEGPQLFWIHSCLPSVFFPNTQKLKLSYSIAMVIWDVCCRQEALASLGFEFDADEAEWTFMYNRLKKAQLKASTENSILDGGFDFLLNNWCSVQRISQRSGMMSSARVDRLDLLEFDWTGADALS